MKKIFLIAIVAVSFSMNAKAPEVQKGNVISVFQEKEYKAIEPSSIPADVLKNISAKYGGYTIKEAHLASDGEYKLILSKDEKTVTAYFSATGELVKEA